MYHLNSFLSYTAGYGIENAVIEATSRVSVKYSDVYQKPQRFFEGRCAPAQYEIDLPDPWGMVL